MRVDRIERRWVWGFALIVMTLTTIPYLIGFSVQNEDWIYTGFIFGVEDGNSYLAKMLLGNAGFWLFRTPYTAYPQNGFMAFLPYLLLGKLATPGDIHTQLVILFHIFRFFGGICYCFATYDFIALFIPSIRYRRLGVALASLGGGLGFFSILGLSGLFKDGLPLEFYSPETFGFLSILGLPHLAFARAFLLWGLAGYFKPLNEKNKLVCWLKNSIWWLLLGFCQPLTVVVGGAVILAHLAFQLAQFLCARIVLDRLEYKDRFKRYFVNALGAAIFAAPMVLYNFISFQMDPFLASWQKQNTILSPPLLDYLMGYAIISIFAVIGIIKIFKERNTNRFILVLIWVLIFPILAYTPYNLQRRLPEGVWVAMVILALVGLERQSLKWRIASNLLIGLSFLSTLVFCIGELSVISKPSEPLYVRKDAVTIYNYLLENAPVDSVVLANYSVSNALPAWAPVRTVIGHGPESVNLKELLPKVEKFYDSEVSVEEKKEFIDSFDISYVICVDNQARGKCKIDQKIGFRLQFEEGAYKLYEKIK